MNPTALEPVKEQIQCRNVRYHPGICLDELRNIAAYINNIVLENHVVFLAYVPKANLCTLLI